MRFFVVNAGQLTAVNKRVSNACHVGAVPILRGVNAGSHAVNVEIFKSDPAFEKARAVLENCPTAEIDPADLQSEEGIT